MHVNFFMLIFYQGYQISILLLLPSGLLCGFAYCCHVHCMAQWKLFLWRGSDCRFSQVGVLEWKATVCRWLQFTFQINTRQLGLCCLFFFGGGG